MCAAPIRASGDQDQIEATQILRKPGETLEAARPSAITKSLHVHHRLDSHELPVEHTTRRTGSPYTLMLSKMTALFEREARDRRSWQTDLDWLTKTRKRFPRDSTGSS